MERKYVLITGAGSGLGRAFALECARKSFDLILVEQPGTGLRSAADYLAYKFGITAHVFEFDLTDTAELHRHIDHIMARYAIFFLINNAGIGGTASILDTPVDRIDKIISLNVRSMALLTRMLIPRLAEHPGSYILNVASMAAFTPIAYKTVYPATKAFVSSFSLGLKEELAEKGVSVSVLYPGPIMTNSSVSRRIIGLGARGKVGLLSTDEIARLALRKALRGRSIIVPGIMNRISQYLLGWVPTGWKLKIVSREVRRELGFSAPF